MLDRAKDLKALNLGPATHAAAYHGRIEALELLLDAGGNVHQYNAKHGGTLIQAAASKGYLDVVKLLLDRGANPSDNAGLSGSALESASHKGFASTAQLLIDRGADITANGSYLGSARYAAKRAGHQKIVKMLVDAGAVASGPTRGGCVASRNSSNYWFYIRGATGITGTIFSQRSHKGETGEDLCEIMATKIVLEARFPTFGMKSRLNLLALAAPAIATGSIPIKYSSLLKYGVLVLHRSLPSKDGERFRPIADAFVELGVMIILRGSPSLLRQSFYESMRASRISVVCDRTDTDLKPILEVALELYIAIYRTGNLQLIEMATTIWVPEANRLVDGVLKTELFDIVNELSAQWFDAVEMRDKAEVQVVGIAAMEVLLAAAGCNAAEVLYQITLICIRRLQEVFCLADTDTEEWVFNHARPIPQVIFRGNDVEFAENIIWVGMEFLLVLAGLGEYSRLWERLLDTAAVVLGKIKIAGLLKCVETAVGDLAATKFSSIYLVSQETNQIDELSTILLDILSRVHSRIGLEDPLLSETIVRCELAIAYAARGATWNQSSPRQKPGMQYLIM